MVLPELRLQREGLNLQVQFITNKEIYATQDHLIFRSMDSGESWETIGRLPPSSSTLFSRAKDKLLRSRIVRRLRRNIGICDLVVLKSGTVLIFYDRIYRLERSMSVAEPVFSFQDNSVSGPLMNGICVDAADDVFFGEYNCDPSPHRVFIMKGSNDGKDWCVAHVFKEGEIRHIHSLRYDRFREKMLVCTGDLSRESNILYWDSSSNHLDKVGGGDQGWRAVSVLPTMDYLYWGSDAGKNNEQGDANYIYRYDFKTHRREKIQEIDNPAYFTTMLEGKYFVLTTTYEGQSESPPCGSIWISPNGTEWERIVVLKYRLRRNSRSRFGIIKIPNYHEEADFLVFTPFNLEGHHSLMKLSLV